MSQYTIISKYDKRMRHLNLKKELKIFPSRNNGGQRNRFATELNEKEVIELLENETPANIKKAIKCGMKIFQGKNLKTLF